VSGGERAEYVSCKGEVRTIRAGRGRKDQDVGGGNFFCGQKESNLPFHGGRNLFPCERRGGAFSLHLIQIRPRSRLLPKREIGKKGN